MTTADLDIDIDIDEQAAEEFAGRLFELFTGATLSCLIDIGRRTGLFDAAPRGPATSDELANPASLQERYVREWLGAITLSSGVKGFTTIHAGLRQPTRVSMGGDVVAPRRVPRREELAPIRRYGGDRCQGHPFAIVTVAV